MALTDSPTRDDALKQMLKMKPTPHKIVGSVPTKKPKTRNLVVPKSTPTK
jgi:hypothetical protein